VLYIFYYPCAAVAFALFYMELGGRLNTMRAAIDFATLVIGFGSLLWFTALAPLSHLTPEQWATKWPVAGYGIGNVIALIAGAGARDADHRLARRASHRVVARLDRGRRSSPTCFGSTPSCATRTCSAAPVTSVYFAYYLALFVAARAQLVAPNAATVTHGLHGDLARAHSHRGPHGRIDRTARRPPAARQRPGAGPDRGDGVRHAAGGRGSVPRDARRWSACTASSATRRFDERLTELVRRSSDMIAICDGRRDHSAMPARLPSLAERGDPASCRARPLEHVLGPAGSHVRTVFDEVLRTAHSEQVRVRSRSRVRAGTSARSRW
jgi:hypothetical protein